MPNAVSMCFSFSPVQTDGNFAKVGWQLNGADQSGVCKCMPGDSFAIVLESADASTNSLNSNSFAVISARKGKGSKKGQASPFAGSNGKMQTGFVLTPAVNQATFSTSIGTVPQTGATGGYEITVSASITSGVSGQLVSFSDDPEMDVGDVGAEYGAATA